MKEFYVIPADKVIGHTFRWIGSGEDHEAQADMKIQGLLSSYTHTVPEGYSLQAVRPVDGQADNVRGLADLARSLEGLAETLGKQSGQNFSWIRDISQVVDGLEGSFRVLLDERMDEVRQLILDQGLSTNGEPIRNQLNLIENRIFDLRGRVEDKIFDRPQRDTEILGKLELIKDAVVDSGVCTQSGVSGLTGLVDNRFEELNKRVFELLKRTEPIDTTAEWTQDVAKAVEASGQREAEYFHLPKKNFKMCGDATKPRWFMDTPVEFTYHLTDLDDVTRNATSGFLSLSSLNPLLTHLGNLQRFYDENKPLKVGEKRKPRLRDRMAWLGNKAAWATAIYAAADVMVGIV